MDKQTHPVDCDDNSANSAKPDPLGAFAPDADPDLLSWMELLDVTHELGADEESAPES